jgi:hypothetical protein
MPRNDGTTTRNTTDTVGLVRSAETRHDADPCLRLWAITEAELGRFYRAAQELFGATAARAAAEVWIGLFEHEEMTEEECPVHFARCITRRATTEFVAALSESNFPGV